MKQMLLVMVLCVGGQALSAPKVKLTIEVVDGFGRAVHGAATTVIFKTRDGRRKLTGLTNSNGVFVVEGETFPKVGVAVHKEGYYRSLDNFYLTSYNLDRTRYEPWGEARTLILEKIIDPKGGKKSGYNGEIPKMDTALGFDMVVGDWVSPYGAGVISDLIFICSNDTKGKVASYILTFPNECDGIIEYPRDKSGQSVLRWPHQAPIKGYSATLKYKMTYTPSGISEELPEYKEVPRDLSDLGYIFRIRTQCDELGMIQSAYYGKISSAIATSWNDLIGFGYWLNTDSSSRSLESLNSTLP